MLQASYKLQAIAVKMRSLCVQRAIKLCERIKFWQETTVPRSLLKKWRSQAPIASKLLKAGSGASWRPQDNVNRHDRSTREIASSRKPCLLALFLRVCRHHRPKSYRHDVPNQWTQRSNQFGMEAAATTAWKPAILVGGCVFTS
jgi:hypothetical protein